MIMLDTERENAMKLGSMWPYEKLNAGECIVTSKFTDANIGDTIQI